MAYTPTPVALSVASVPTGRRDSGGSWNTASTELEEGVNIDDLKGLSLGAGMSDGESYTDETTSDEGSEGSIKKWELSSEAEGSIKRREASLRGRGLHQEAGALAPRPSHQGSTLARRTLRRPRQSGGGGGSHDRTLQCWRVGLLGEGYTDEATLFCEGSEGSIKQCEPASEPGLSEGSTRTPEDSRLPLISEESSDRRRTPRDAPGARRSDPFDLPPRRDPTARKWELAARRKEEGGG
eukprot:CAMPEP_0118925708 /NCGR_PEP_ID=MMETSP1169-20130426/3552_1 /TAXON_ID=36882 /ORGANISM="Pyramimonas obovata, Strain CCMP722" /LENGTH=238 /DNA_ID=CAMNT_0006867083 /DNA_START=36 /DNA_END=751 /DNA_ORIENTATION=+